ncbi:MAG TPA: DUF1524 domain-containing protein, partial [Pyrinomonadaceae bacterium]|nr:DUF1524 domain-containing protein [Pyrinomonadaceae bacterium]
TGLYERVWNATQEQDGEYPWVFFNSLNELDSQFMLVLSACSVDDPEETEKIREVSAGLDRMFALLQLQGAYDSNEFAARLYDVSTQMRGRQAAEIAAIFDKHLVEELVERRGTQTAEAFSYALFRPMSIDRLNTRFTRHFFGRIDLVLAMGMNQKPKHELKDLVTLRGAKSGFHVEHILSRNAVNLALFESDEERFEVERNRLGAVLLLKGKDNISSNNETFEQKLKTYSNSLYWNETLREDCYKSKLDFAAFIKEHNLTFEPYSVFGQAQVESRQKLLFHLAKLIWPEGAGPSDQDNT